MAQFSRTQMIIGKNALATLKNKHVAIFGIGGVGGYVCESLARLGISYFTLIDNDVISLSNINRQIIASHSTLNQYKVDVMKKRILDINPNAIVNVSKTFVLEDTINEFDFTKFDYVVDAIDTVTAKLLLISQCTSLNVPIISSMGTGNKIHPEMLEITDISKTEMCPLAKVMRHELKKRNIKHLKVCFSKEKPLEIIEKEYINNKIVPGSTPFVPSVAGLLIGCEVCKDLINNSDVK